MATSLVLIRSAYYPGTKITWRTVESLATRLLADLVGMTYDGHSHVGLIDEENYYEICSNGFLLLPGFNLAQLEDGSVSWHDYVEHILLIPCYPFPPGLNEESVTPVTITSLLQKLFGLTVTGALCTDIFDCWHNRQFSHPSVSELVHKGILHKEIVGDVQQWEHYTITPDATNAGRVTTSQFILMGAATALGAGYLIRETRSAW